MNKLIIASAGSGKTTSLVEQALRITNENVLITTYTVANGEEIRKKIIEKVGYIPSNITIQNWFSFLIQHGVRPFKGSLFPELFEKDIGGLVLIEGSSNVDKTSDGKIYSKYSSNEKEFYFTKEMRIKSDVLSHFVCTCNEKCDNYVMERISQIFQHIFIDEVQDLAGYDLEIIKLFCKNENIQLLMAGDPRQTVYSTNHHKKYVKYKDGKIKDFINEKINTKNKILCEIDETTLLQSHRCSKAICEFASKIFENEFLEMRPCSCEKCVEKHKLFDHPKILFIEDWQIDDFLKEHRVVQLRYNKTTNIRSDFLVYNFGESKGLTFDKVLIYPTDKIKKCIKSGNFVGLKEHHTKAGFYVAITRARYLLAIVCDSDFF
jgi:DNA helicase-2/ATP-dependent DNA helicase PcrA